MANERLRSIKVGLPPPDVDSSWARDVTSSINGLPISLFSTSDGPNSSNVTAPQGFLGIEVGSSSTRFWIKESGSTSTGWSSVATGDNHKAYGEMYYPFSDSVITLSGVSTLYTAYTSWLRNDETKGLSFVTATGIATVTTAGLYKVDFAASVSGQNNTEYDFEFHKNGSEISHGVRVVIQTAGDVETAAIVGLVRFASNDTFEVAVKSDNASGADIGTYNSTLAFVRIDA